MVENRLYKLIASFVAIFVYIILIYSLVSYMQSKTKLKKDYGFNVEDAIVVNIDTLLKQPPKPKEKPIKKIELPKKNVAELKPKPEPKKIIESDVEEKVEKDSRDKAAKSAKDLFSTVRTDKYTKAMKEHQKQEEARASRLKKQKAQQAKKKAKAEKEKKKQKRAQKLIQEMKVSKPSAHKKSGEIHEFWSFISNKIMAKWQRTIATYDGLSSTVIIRIDNQGRLTYSDLITSGSPLFDTKLKTFLDNLEYERFPSYKYGSFIEAEFEFTDKERGI